MTTTRASRSVVNLYARRAPAASILLVGVLWPLGPASVPARAGERDPDALIRLAAESADRTWQKVGKLPESLTPREILAAALALCEAKKSPERLETLFTVAGRLQDRDAESPGYGNFRWRWGDGSVKDYNAVEFAMQPGALIWLRHEASLPKPARKVLREILDHAVQGCLRHAVPPSYTNIALMNAENLILLGEALGRPEVADEGYARLRRFVLYTWECGIHEFDSPTYYGVDLECLLLIEQFCRRPEGKAAARALLELFWTDIAANWFQANLRLAGAHSRDYDYLRGRGHLEVNLWAAGWLDGPPRAGTWALWPALTTWQPPKRLRDMSLRQLPRLVRQSWGVAAMHFKTHYLCADVTLSSSGANYGPMDLPLTVDLPGKAESLRGYFLPDARRDPYGKKKIPAGSHFKTLHLRPFWAAAQRRTDALGIVVYRERTVREGPATLESHFVMPLDADELWAGPANLRFEAETPRAVPMPAGQAMILRKGTAAVGVRVVWSRGTDGKAAPAAVVWDGNPHGALRVTVAHHSFWGVTKPLARAGAALWVRIGSGLKDDAAFTKWRTDFAAAKVQVAEKDDSGERLAVRVSGADGPVALTVAPAYSGCLEVDPAPAKVILEIDGKDVGRELLKDLAPVKSYRKAVLKTEVLPLAAQGTYWEAEAGHVTPPMTVAKDLGVSGGRYVWCPGRVGGRGPAGGHVTWRLKVPRTGTYYLWGRVQAPSPTDDSFYLRVFSDTAEPVGLAAWHTGQHAQWEWTPVKLEQADAPTPLMLPAGEIRLQLRAREDGTRIDRLFLTPDANQSPQ